MVEKLITKIANSQAFSPEDNLSRMVKESGCDELAVENLDFVYAAHMDDSGYAAFLKMAQDREGKHK